MAKKKYDENATLMGRMGFRDPDMKSTTHDALIAWLYEDKNLTKILLEIIQQKITQHTLNSGFLSISKYDALINALDSKQIKMLHYKKIVEQPLKNEKDYEIGFIDMSCYSRLNIGYYEIDIISIFEVKTQEITLGELLRQLNMYQHHWTNPFGSHIDHDLKFYIVILPKDHSLKKYSKIIEEQRWSVIEIDFEELHLLKQNNNLNKFL